LGGEGGGVGQEKHWAQVYKGGGGENQLLQGNNPIYWANRKKPGGRL